MEAASQVIATHVDALNQVVSDNMTYIQTIFKAIGKIAIDDPVLAVSLAHVGAFVAERADGDLDTISMQLDRAGKEIH